MQTSIKSCSAADSESNREPERTRESKREPERAREGQSEPDSEPERLASHLKHASTLFCCKTV